MSRKFVRKISKINSTFAHKKQYEKNLFQFRISLAIELGGLFSSKSNDSQIFSENFLAAERLRPA